MTRGGLGRIVLLNGAPRSGKSSIARVMQDTFDGAWMDLGVDVFVREITPPRHRPGVGLRPGNDLPELRALVPALYEGMFGSIAAHSRAGLSVVAGVGLYDPEVIARCRAILEGLPTLWVGVRCPIEVIMERRNAGEPGREGQYATGTPSEPVPAPVLRWQNEIHRHMRYDLEVDTSRSTPEECAAAIATELARVEQARRNTMNVDAGRVH